MHQPSRTVYFATFAGLMVLLAMTVGVSLMHLGRWELPATMTIAIAKAVLIVLFFMHARYEVPLVRVFAVAGVLWLLLLFTFLMCDYATRTDVVPRMQLKSARYVHHSQ